MKTLLGSILLVAAIAGAAASESGRVAITWYDQDRLQADAADWARAPGESLHPHQQNWAIAFGAEDQVFVANGTGLLIHDGVSWQHAQSTHGNLIYAIDVQPDGRVYAGVAEDLGYFERDAQGFYHFVSVIPDDASLPQFGEIGRVVVVDGVVFYAARRYVFRWHEADGLSWVEMPGSGRDLNSFDGRVILQMSDRPPVTVDLATLEFSPDPLAACLDGVVYFAGGDRGIGWSRDGLWRREGNCLVRWPTALDAWMAEHRAYAAEPLPDGGVIVGSRRAGAAIVNADGSIRQFLDASTGLEPAWVTDIAVHPSGQAWLSFGDEGVALIDLASGITYFNRQDGMRGVEAIARFGETLVVGTQFGLFRLDPGEDGQRGRFVQLLPEITAVWSLRADDDRLLIGTDRDLLEVTVDDAGVIGQPRVVFEGTNRVSAINVVDERTAYATLGVGLLRLEREAEGWMSRGSHAEIGVATQFVEADPVGNLWVGSLTGEYFFLPAPIRWPDAEWRRFGAEDGVPPSNAHIFALDGDILFGTFSGVHRFDGERFEPDPAFGELAEDVGIKRVAQAVSGEAWIAAGSRVGRLVGAASGQWTPFQPEIVELRGTPMFGLHVDADGTTWIGGASGLWRFHADAYRTAGAPTRVLVRNVANLGTGELIFAGIGARGALTMETLARTTNRLRFRFSLPDYRLPEAVRYRTRLLGQDAGWSPWTDESQRDFTGLGSGSYTLEVMARGPRGQESAVTRLSFAIETPWYATPTMRSLAAVAALLLLWAATRAWVRVRTRRLQTESDRLESLVRSRTHALEAKQVELEEANERLLRLSLTDPLTGLENRRALTERFGHHQDKGVVVFLLLDVDAFKAVNDAYGHDAGDRILTAMAARMRNTTGDRGQCYRWGGEEFLIVMTGDGAPTRLAGDILGRIGAEPFDIGRGREVRCTLSIGIAPFPFYPSQPDRLNWEQALRLADLAMYSAKSAGRNAWVQLAPGRPPEDTRTSAFRAIANNLEESVAAGRVAMTSSQPPSDEASARRPEHA